MRIVIAVPICMSLSVAASAEMLKITPQPIIEWKPVYGEVATRVRVPARARIGGIVQALGVTEGDQVEAGARLARIVDDKMQFQIDALNARLLALRARLATAESELRRGEQLGERGVVTAQRLDQLRTDVDVLLGEISEVEADRLVIEQQIAEGDVLAPETGVVLSVPMARGSVVTPGEAVAEIGAGGAYLRLAVPERFAMDLAEGDRIAIGPDVSGPVGLAGETGELVKLYPMIEGGRVQADVEIEGLDARYVGRRVPVRLPVGKRNALLVSETAIETRGGLDFVVVETSDGVRERTIVPGEVVDLDGQTWREVLTGISPGDIVVIPDG